MIDWRVVDENTNACEELLLFFPAKTVGAYRQSALPAMRKVGRIDAFPNRKPSHYAILSNPE